MIRIKFYECAICNSLNAKGVKGIEKFYGSRKDVRKHLVDEHHIKGRKNKNGVSKKEFGKSNISKNTLAKEMK